MRHHRSNSDTTQPLDKAADQKTRRASLPNLLSEENRGQEIHAHYYRVYSDSPNSINPSKDINDREVEKTIYRTSGAIKEGKKNKISEEAADSIAYTIFLFTAIVRRCRNLTPLIKKALENGANLNAVYFPDRESVGFLALQSSILNQAIMAENIDAIDILLEHKLQDRYAFVKKTVFDTNKRQPVSIPMGVCNSLILACEAPEQGFTIATKLLEKGCPINDGHHNNLPKTSALHAAVQSGRPELVESILSYGANTEKVDSKGRTSIGILAERIKTKKVISPEDEVILNSLLSRGANISNIRQSNSDSLPKIIEDLQKEKPKLITDEDTKDKFDSAVKATENLINKFSPKKTGLSLMSKKMTHQERNESLRGFLSNPCMESGKEAKLQVSLEELKNTSFKTSTWKSRIEAVQSALNNSSVRLHSQRPHEKSDGNCSFGSYLVENEDWECLKLAIESGLNPYIAHPILDKNGKVTGYEETIFAQLHNMNNATSRSMIQFISDRERGNYDLLKHHCKISDIELQNDAVATPASIESQMQTNKNLQNTGRERKKDRLLDKKHDERVELSPTSPNFPLPDFEYDPNFTSQSSSSSADVSILSADDGSEEAEAASNSSSSSSSSSTMTSILLTVEQSSETSVPISSSLSSVHDENKEEVAASSSSSSSSTMTSIPLTVEQPSELASNPTSSSSSSSSTISSTPPLTSPRNPTAHQNIPGTVLKRPDESLKDYHERVRFAQNSYDSEVRWGSSAMVNEPRPRAYDEQEISKSK